MTELTKEELKHLYCVKKYSLNEIAKKINRSYTYVYNKKCKWGIPTVQYYERWPKQTLDTKEIEFLTGSLLGDGSLEKVGKTSMGHSLFSVKQSVTKKEYMLHINNTLKDWIRRKDLETVSSGVSLDGSQLFAYRIKTISHPVFDNLRRDFYPNDFKRPNLSFLEKWLTPYGLAIWIMDDGRGSKHGVANYIALSTDGFLGEDTKALRDLIESKFGIVGNLHKRPVKSSDQRYEIFFNKHNSIKLSNLVFEHVIDSMKYKLVYS